MADGAAGVAPTTVTTLKLSVAPLGKEKLSTFESVYGVKKVRRRPPPPPAGPACPWALQCRAPSAAPRGTLAETQRSRRCPAPAACRTAGFPSPPQYPLHVVCYWIGNSEIIAARHYLQVTDDFFRLATREVGGAGSGALAA
jgi:hypothetical protein